MRKGGHLFVLVTKIKEVSFNLNKSIEEKFNNSSMNKAYAFPRKDDKQPWLANSVF